MVGVEHLECLLVAVACLLVVTLVVLEEVV